MRACLTLRRVSINAVVRGSVLVDWWNEVMAIRTKTGYYFKKTLTKQARCSACVMMTTKRNYKLYTHTLINISLVSDKIFMYIFDIFKFNIVGFIFKQSASWQLLQIKVPIPDSFNFNIQNTSKILFTSETLLFFLF